MRILVVEDELYVAQAVEELLTERNYAVDIAADGEAGLAMADVYAYDLIMLDIGLPKLDGVEICKQLRDRGYQNPILLLTGRAGGESKAIALNAGADDYVVKPFDAIELVARVQALLRRPVNGTRPILTWGSLTFDPNTRQVSYGDSLRDGKAERLLKLTPKEYAILELLLRSPRSPLSSRAILDSARRTLRERAWAAEEVPADEVIRTHIKQLRQKLTAAGAPKDLLKTVHGVGYRLNPQYAAIGAEPPSSPQAIPHRGRYAIDPATENAELRDTLDRLRSTQDTLRASEERYRLLSELSPVGIFRNGVDGHCTYVNQRTAQLVGYSPAECFALNWLDTLHPDVGVASRNENREWVYQSWCDFMARSKIELAATHSFECRHLHPHGAIVWVLVHVVPERDSQGTITGYMGTLTDITERKLAEASVRQSEERLRRVLDGMGEGFGLLAPDFTILEHNREALRLDGRAREEIVGRSHWEVYPGSATSELGRLYIQAMTDRVPVSLEHLYAWEEDRARWLEMRAYPTDDGSLAVFWRDVTDRHEAQESLRESEAKYRSLFESMDEAYAVVEVMADDRGEWNDFLFLEVNPAFVQQTGMEYPVGRKASELLGTPNPQWAQVYGRVAETGEPIRFEEDEATLERVFDLYVFRLGGEGSRRVAVLFNDITDRKRVEEQLRCAAEMDAFRVKLLDALYSLSDPIEIQTQACRLLGEQLGVDRAYYVEIHEPEGYARVNRHYSRGDSPSIVGNYRLSEYGWSLPPMRRGETIVITDTQSTDIIPDAERAAMATIDMIGFVTVPLIKGEVLVGALAVNEPTPREWTEAEVELVRETAERIWADIQRAHAETALRVSETKYRSLFESIHEGFALVEILYDDDNRPIDCRYIEVSPSFETQTGLSQAQGKTLRELIPSIEPHWFEYYDRALVTNALVHFEMYQHQTGIWFEVDALPYGNPDERQVTIVFRNINDRKRREANLVFLAEVSQDLVRLTDIGTTMNALGAKIGTYFNLLRCLLVEIDEARGVAEATFGWSRAGSIELVGEYQIADFVEPEILRSLRAEETVVVIDAIADPRTNGETYAAIGVAATVNVPLLRAGEWRFMLAFSDSQPRDWLPDEIELMRELATRIWTRLERARTEVALRASEEKYRTLFNSIDEGFATIEVIFDRADRSIRQSRRYANDFRYLEVNPAFERLTGLIGATGQTILDLVPDFDRSIVEQYGRVATSGESIRFEICVEALENRWFSVHASRLGGAGSRLVAVVFDNITERKRAEIGTQASLDIALEAAQMGTWSLDFQRDTAPVRSLQHDRIFGYDTLQPEWGREIARRHILPEDWEIYDAAFDRAMTTGELDFEVRVRWPDDSIHWIAARGRFETDRQGNLTFGSGVNFDITDRKQAEAEFQAQQRLLAQVTDSTAAIL